MLSCSICNAELKWWCTTQDWEYFTSNEQYTYYQCVQCKSICIHPLPSGGLSNIYPPHYYSFQEKSGNIIFQIKEWLDRRYFIKLLNKLPGPEIHILDIGGGNGWLLNLIAKSHPGIRSTTIVDINEACRPVAEKNGHMFHLSRIEDFESTKKFDLILMLNLIEHVQHPEKVLSKLSVLLTDTGICLIKTPNAESLDARLFRSTYWGGLHCPRHWTIYTAQSFRKQLSRLPLFIQRLHFTQGAPFWSYSILVLLFGKSLWKHKRPLIKHPLFTPLSALFACVDFVRSPFAPTSQLYIEIKKKPAAIS
ncbi:MAG: class I SAM-dependent methyltransferase [Chitinophagaceae bacterium]